MPRVARLSIAPVRSLGLEHRDEIQVEPNGVLEDRRFYVIDAGGRLVDQLIAASMVQVTAWTDPEATRLRLSFPDGTVVEDEVRLAEPIETEVHKRTAVGHVVDGPWAAPLSTFLGREVRLVRCDRPGGTRTKHPTSLVTDGSMAALSAALGVGEVDSRRFRMLIELEDGAAHEEDTWVGCRVGLGGTILRISAPVPRCAMTTHDPDTGERDHDTLRAILDYRGQNEEKEILFGVWGEVEQPGTISLGDEVRVLAG
jgi:uncharacterized protein YcbX